MRYSNIFYILTCILIFLFSGPVMALSSDRDTESRQPDITIGYGGNTEITSDTMEFNMKKSILVFKNNVTVTNSQYTLWCDTLLISSDKDNTPESMQAEGNIRIKAENGEATCKKATYSRLSGQFILEQGVILKQKNSDLSADKIIAVVKNGHFEGIRGEGNIRGSLPLKQIIQDKESVPPDKDNSMVP